MAYYPYAIEIGGIYTLTSPAGVEVVFNDPSDPNYAAMLTEVTGLDSPDVRESGSDLVEADGGVHGYFYFGRRPITLTGRVFGHLSVAERNLRLDAIRRASLALRGDSTLAFKPCARRENLLANPSFELDTAGWTASASTGMTGVAVSRTTAWATQGVGALRAQGTQPNDTTSRNLNAITSGGVSGTPVNPNTSYTVTATANHIDAPSQGSRVGIAWYDAAGNTSGPTVFSAFQGAGAVGVFSHTFAAVAPAGTRYARVLLSTSANVANDVIDAYWDAVLLTETSMGSTYFDGDTPGFFWQGDAHKTTSGDFIEMFTTVRRQQPWRESGTWVKDFQLGLVSEYAVLFSLQQRTLGPDTVIQAENRGNYIAYPLLRITGTAVNPQISDGHGGLLITTGLTLASGETIEIDTLNHTATFIAGARNGQSGNRYIDFTNTLVWPSIPAGTTTFTIPSGGGTLVVVWRDTWA